MKLIVKLVNDCFKYVYNTLALCPVDHLKFKWIRTYKGTYWAS